MQRRNNRLFSEQAFNFMLWLLTDCINAIREMTVRGKQQWRLALNFYGKTSVHPRKTWPNHAFLYGPFCRNSDAYETSWYRNNRDITIWKRIGITSPFKTVQHILHNLGYIFVDLSGLSSPEKKSNLVIYAPGAQLHPLIRFYLYQDNYDEKSLRALRYLEPAHSNVKPYGCP